MKIGYALVSINEQNPSLQFDALKVAGCERVFEDRASGAKADRPGLADALAFAHPGDVLVCWRLDRLGRSIRHLIEISETLQARNIELLSLQEQIDTTTAGGRAFLNAMATLAEFERELTQERTQAGLAAARARGRTGGRKPLDDKTIAEIRRLAALPNVVIKDVCKTLGVSRATFYKYSDAG